MRHITNPGGIGRLRKQSNYVPGQKCYISSSGRLVESEDTRIRKDIYTTIITMMRQKKGNIEIEVFLRNKYPDYAEYIPKVINDQFAKYGISKTVKSKDKEDGESR